jgi:hypothetical protein
MIFAMTSRLLAALLLLLPQQVTGQDIDKILEKADALLEEAKAGYEEGRSNSSVPRFLEASFKLEEARIKYLVLQEIGQGDKQKIAADRLRAVNQLAKLIHDGKVAITGKPAESAPEKPAPGAPPPPPDAPVKPAPPPMKAAEVTTRAEVPDAARQKDAARLVKELFKDQYAKKAPADRKALARTLLEQASKTNDDRAAQWVLYQEAADAAVLGGDIKTAFEAIDGATRFFDVDAAPLKQAALTAAGKTATAPEEFAALATALDRMVDEGIAADQYDSAEKAAALALQYARRSKDVALAIRLTNRSKEVADAKAKFKSMKNALETLAKNPEDPPANAELGQFLCFVKGSWDLGLRFLAKGGDPVLRKLAEQELSYPTKSADLLALGDGWWELAAKEKNPTRKTQIQIHLRPFYEDAMVEATGLQRVRTEKRLTELEDAQLGAPINLLRAIDPKADTVKGTWALEGKNLVAQDGAPMTLMVPYQPPEEYDLTVVLTRKGGYDAIAIGLVAGSAQFDLILDGHAGVGCISGFELIDGKYVNQHPDAVKGRQVNQNQTVTVLCLVRKTSVTALVNGQKLAEYQGNTSRLGLSVFYQVPNPKALILGAFGGKIEFHKVVLQPVTGQGKRLR